jgi:serine/threonine protein kinase
MLLEPDNSILLSDFGIAVVAHSSHSLNTQDIIGTVAYMAPEQLQGKPRLASDQYALAVVVYEWLSGSWPFSGAYVEIAIQHALTPPLPLRDKMPTISPEVEQVVMKALAKDPHQRFASVQDFATALEQASRPARSGTLIPAPQPQSTPAQPPRGAAAKPASAIKPEEFTLIRTLQGLSNALSSVAFSPDGQTLASGSEDKTIKLWNLYTGQLLHTLQGHSNMVWSVAISPDGQILASGSDDQTIKIWGKK